MRGDTARWGRGFPSSTHHSRNNVTSRRTARIRREGAVLPAGPWHGSGRQRMGSIWAAYRQRMGSVRAAYGQRTGSVQWAVCRQCTGSMQAAYGQPMGSLRAAYRQHIGSVWAAYGQHAGSCLPQLHTALQGQRLCATWDTPAPGGVSG